MPQLMPLNWNFSIFMVMLILLIMVIFYSVKDMKIEEKMISIMKSKNMVWWW